MRIQHNIPAMNAYRNYNGNTKALQGNLQKLSSGYKINKAGDDAAGLAISEKMRAQITGLEVAQKNAKDGISLVQTAEGAMTEIHTMLNRMFSLAEQSANGTYDNEVDRKQLNNEFQKLQEEIDRIADATNFNGKELLNGKLAGSTTAPVADIGTDAAGLVDPAKIADKTVDPKDVVKVEMGANANDQQKADLTNALKNGKLTVKFDEAGGTTAGTLDAGDKITIDGLPDGYTVTTTDEAGNTIAVGNGVALEFGTGADSGKLSATPGPIELTLTKDGKDVGKITLDLTNAKPVDGKTTEISFADAPAAATNDGGGGGGTVTTSVDVKYDPANNGANFGGTPTINITATGQDKDDLITALDGADITLEFSDTTGNPIGNGDTVKLANMPAGYKLFGTSTNGATKVEITAGGTNFGNAANLKAPTAGGTWSLEIQDNAGNKVADLTVTAPTTGPNGQDEQVSLSFTKKTTGGGAGGAGGGGTTTTPGAGLRLRVGDSTNTYDDITVNIKSMKAESLADITEGTGKVLNDLSVDTQDNADMAMKALKGMINYVSDQRGELGATQNRLDHTINNLSTMQENIQDAEATIRDVDVAEEMMKYTKNNILVQSAQAMLAQANQLPQGVLQLLG